MSHCVGSTDLGRETGGEGGPGRAGTKLGSDKLGHPRGPRGLGGPSLDRRVSEMRGGGRALDRRTGGMRTSTRTSQLVTARES